MIKTNTLNFLFIFVQISLVVADISCNKKYLEASIFERSFQFFNYSSNKSCTWHLIPSSKFANVGDYYLELKWTHFDLRADMPNCTIAHMDIYIGKEERYVGRFCSKGKPMLMLPFDIYALDGRAKISFRSSTAGGGFSFSYVMRSKRTDYIGASPNCSSIQANSSQEFFLLHSPGWPMHYNHRRCRYHIQAGDFTWTKLVFLDVDFQFDTLSWPRIKNFISIKGWNENLIAEDLLTDKYMQVNDFVTIVAKHDNINIELGGGYNLQPQRGLLVGVIKYGEEDIALSERGHTLSIVFGAVFVVLTLVIIISFIITKGLCHKNFKDKKYLPLVRL